MPTINNATVATGTGLSTAGNGGRKLVKLANGWLVTGILNGTTDIRFFVSKDDGNTWSFLCYGQTSGWASGGMLSLVSSGTWVYSISANNNNGTVLSHRFNAATIAVGAYAINAGNADNGQAGTNGFSGTSLAINDAGTELHAAWSSKNSTYPNAFNIRYAKGSIAADGSVTWSAVEQRTTVNQVGYDNQKPSIMIKKDGYSVIVWETALASQNGIYGQQFNGSSWVAFAIFNGASHIHSNPSAIFIPQSINGLTNGRLWVTWHGKDATDSAKFNIRTSFSDDGGATWSTPVKQTSGNLYDQMNASLTADAQGKVLLTWDAQNATTTQTALKVFNGTWGATTTLTGDGYTNVSTLFDNTFKLSMTTPPLIRQSASGVYFSGNYFTGASISPASGALGDKTASSVLSYTVTPESGSTITSIVEKVNGTTVNTYSNPASLSRTFTIPPANWDALKYYNAHTVSVTVTDSNGMANTQTYTFNKTLANDASLLEGAKAAKDGKDRISTKRDGIAGQVGLSAGSTFDAISLALSNNLMKFSPGVVTTANDAPYNISVTGLSFKPKLVVWFKTPDWIGIWVDPSLTSFADNRYVAYANTSNNNTSRFGSTTQAIITANGFTFATNFGASTAFNYIAFG